MNLLVSDIYGVSRNNYIRDEKPDSHVNVISILLRSHTVGGNCVAAQYDVLYMDTVSRQCEPRKMNSLVC